MSATAKALPRPAGPGAALLAALAVGMPWPAAIEALARDQGLHCRAVWAGLMARDHGHGDLAVTVVGHGLVAARCGACGFGLKLQIVNQHLFSTGRALDLDCPHGLPREGTGHHHAGGWGRVPGVLDTGGHHDAHGKVHGLR